MAVTNEQVTGTRVPDARADAGRPCGLDALCAPTRAATGESAPCRTASGRADSDIETVVREVRTGEFRFVAPAHGFPDAGGGADRCPGPVRARAGAAGHAPRPGRAMPVGARSGREAARGRVRQPSEARASFQVADGRMTAAALAGSGW